MGQRPAIFSGLQIKGNYIGTAWTGNQPLPNGDATAMSRYIGGIQLQGSASIAKPAAITRPHVRPVAPCLGKSSYPIRR